MKSYCQAGHESHSRTVVDTQLEEMMIYNYKKYMGYKGYCTGQDDVSRTLDLYGVWEPTETQEIRKVLNKHNQYKLFVDVGAHIGWYSLLASRLGYKVLAYEADPENCKVLNINCPSAEVEKLWIDENTKPIDEVMDIELLKIDIEGSERHAIKMFEKSIEAGTIKNIHMEVSPVFNDTYPVLIDYLEGVDYEVFDHGKLFNHNYNFTQNNLLFRYLGKSPDSGL